jgi:hypothetical protein
MLSWSPSDPTQIAVGAKWSWNVMRTLRSSLRRLFPIKHVVRMRHHHLLSQLAQPPAYPRRMHSRFQRHPAARHSPEQFSHCVRSRADLWFHSHFPGRVQDAVPARPISQIVSRWPSIFPPPVLLQWRSSSSPVSFISGAFERVDNLRTYRIPSESGLIIPSVCDSYLKQPGELSRWRRMLVTFAVSAAQ